MISREKCLEWASEYPHKYSEYCVDIVALINRAYQEGQKADKECLCDFRGKLLGDGCSICNPKKAREIASYNEGYADGQKEMRERAADVVAGYGEYPCYLINSLEIE